MKLAQKGPSSPSAPTCPRRPSGARRRLRAADQLVTIGAGERCFEIGNETVLYRHEKTFYHQPGLVVRVSSDDARSDEVAGRTGDYAWSASA